MKKVKNIQVIGRRWFQKSFGNTYHSVQVFVDGELIGYMPFAYGYGDQYMQSAYGVLKENGYLSDMRNDEMLWRYCQDKGITLTYSASDVNRKKDL